MSISFELLHPYARYGLAVALLHERITFADLVMEGAPEVLVRAIEAGLNSFRVATEDDPATAETLRFRFIKYDELQSDPSLIQGPLSGKGKFLAPNIVSNDGKAGKTYAAAVQLLQALRDEKGLLSCSYKLARSFAPTTAKLNNGNPGLKEPKGTLFEAACSTITTLSPIKPAGWTKQPPEYEEQRNTTIIPDLPIDEMSAFVELFRDMMAAGTDNLMEARLSRRPAEQSEQATGKKTNSKRANKVGASKTPKSEYKRPPLFGGNYPFAPQHPAFGTVGLLAAIGRWAIWAGERERARCVLQSIAGTDERPGRPLYVISYDRIHQVQFAHHVVELAIAGKLSEIIEGLLYDTRLMDDLNSVRPSVNSNKFETAYRMLHLLASRFLQVWSSSAFQDFFATRAEYSPKLQPLFEVYFMNARKIEKEIVRSARAYGQWLNRAAYFIAKSEVEKDSTPDKRHEKIMKEKAKILVELESAARSAKSSLDLLDRVQTRAHRLLQQDAPAEATPFMDAAASGDLDPDDALHLLAAYMRLRSPKTEESDGASIVADPYATA